MDAVESEGHLTDSCEGHAAPTGDVYHIHSGIGLDTNVERANCGLPQTLMNVGDVATHPIDT